MNIFQEPILYQHPHLCIKTLDFVCNEEESKEELSWHYHKEIEFVMVMQGTHEIRTVKHSYMLYPGDVAIVGSSQLHYGRKKGSGEMKCFVLHFDLEPYFDPAMMSYYRNFSEIHYQLDELNDLFTENPSLKIKISGILHEIRREMQDRSKGYEIAASMHIKHLLLLLLRADKRGILEPADWGDSNTLKKIIDYVDLNLTSPISMDEVSRLAGMSYSYFSKFFKKAMGNSFTDYINLRRMRNVERMLATSNQSVTILAEQAGFTNPSHFYKLFKRQNGCTPNEYRARLKKN
ncbi:AraC family transcriptional regulator [Paenibacillus brevis]|uniref:AraC family transcriptional regulator n=1 Tax=Paenibacillus brevis TaxID=2841508 RepID=A0ABS6FQF4_9BACL|nr:AraC family transcriptional regulator [Paenibacillus brevis]MBU5672359.1 AraC family transcriptional regulator [Paenibacillus brevis]